jgi:CBS-domain-containing membrane protein
MGGFSMSPVFSKSQIAFASAGAVLAVSALSFLADATQALMVLGSFGASTLLLFALPDAPLAQPRAVVGGHLIASVIALICLMLFGPQWWSVGTATGLAVGCMMWTRTLHPPAGSNAIIVFFAKPTWGLLLFSTLAGTLLLIAIAIIYHRTTRRHRYPRYWRVAPEADRGSAEATKIEAVAAVSS